MSLESKVVPASMLPVAPDPTAKLMYGQVHPEETPDLLSNGQEALEKELNKIPIESKTGWLKANKQCLALVNEEHKLLFLRCEVFNAKVSEWCQF